MSHRNEFSGHLSTKGDAVAGTLCRPENSTVNHPDHYTAGAVECIDAIAAATTGLEGIEAVCTGNAIKYLWRWKRKNGYEDLQKAVWYIQRMIGSPSP
jgi:hypothetical protein